MSFLSDFRDYTAGAEVHPTHAIWAGLTCLSALAGKKIWLPHGHFNVYLNLYTIYVSPPGMRKSTALNFAVKFLEDAKGPSLAMDCTSREALVSTMSKLEVAFRPPDGGPSISFTPMVLLAPEMSELLGVSRDGMSSLLTTIYDKVGDFNAATIKRKLETISNPYLVLLGCATPKWITERLKDDVISGGFARRCIWLYESERPKRVTMPFITDAQAESWRRCVVYGQQLKRVNGLFRFTQESFRLYDSWYQSQVAPTEEALTGYYDSKHIQVLKVAMLWSLSESFDLVITPKHLHHTLELFELLETNLHRVFEGVGRNELHGLSSTLLNLLRTAGGELEEKRVYACMFASGTEYEIRQVVDHLITSEKVFLGSKPAKVEGTPPIRMLLTAEKAREHDFNQRKPNGQNHP